MPRRCLTRIGGLPPRFMGFRYPEDPAESDAEQKELRWIDERPEGTSVTHRVPVQIDFADRFMAKISLGFAHTILGAATSPYCDDLRTLLWSRDPGQREGTNIRGTGFWNSGSLDQVAKFTHWPGVWSIFFMQMQSAFGLLLCTPNGRHLAMMLSDDASTWQAEIPNELRHGAAYLILPQRKRTFGPIPMMSIVSHRLGNHAHPDLTVLEGMRTGLAQLPTKNPTASDGTP